MSVLEESVNKYNVSATLWNEAKREFDELTEKVTPYILDHTLPRAAVESLILTSEKIIKQARTLLKIQMDLQDLGVWITEGSQLMKPESLMALPDDKLLNILFFPLALPKGEESKC